MINHRATSRYERRCRGRDDRPPYGVLIVPSTRLVYDGDGMGLVFKLHGKNSAQEKV